MLGQVKRPALADWNLVRKCTNRLDAIRVCVQLSGLAYQDIAESLGMNKGNFTRMMQGRAHFPDSKSIKLMELCGNFAPMQYEAWACGFELVDTALLSAIRERAA